MLFREIVAVYSENPMKSVNTFCGQNKFFNIKVNDRYSNHYGLNG
jgi:hypothetical protein